MKVFAHDDRLIPDVSRHLHVIQKLIGYQLQCIFRPWLWMTQHTNSSCLRFNIKRLSKCRYSRYENKTEVKPSYLCSGNYFTGKTAHLYQYSLLGRGPLFTKQTDVLSQYLVKSRSREIRVYTIPIALKFDRHLGSIAAEMSGKFQSDTIILTSNLGALRLHEIWRWDVLPLSE